MIVFVQIFEIKIVDDMLVHKKKLQEERSVL